MDISPEIRAKIDMWKRKAIDGTLSPEEMREAVDVVRAGRLTAANAATASKGRKVKAVTSADDLIRELGELE